MTKGRYTHPVGPGDPAPSAIFVPLRHNVTVDGPVSAAIRYHLRPFTAPLQVKLIRWAVSTGYADPSAIVNGGTTDGRYRRSLGPGGGGGVVVVLDGAVVDGAVVDGAVVDGAVVEGAVVEGAVVDELVVDDEVVVAEVVVVEPVGSTVSTTSAAVAHAL